MSAVAISLKAVNGKNENIFLYQKLPKCIEFLNSFGLSTVTELAMPMNYIKEKLTFYLIKPWRSTTN